MTTVLYLNPAAILGGAERSLLDLVSRLSPAFRPVVVVPQPGPLVEALDRAGIRSVCLDPGRWARVLSRRRPIAALAAGALALPGLLAAAGPARRLLEEERVALIHTNGIKAHLWGGRLGRWTGRPVVCHVRDLLGTRWLDERIAAEIRRTATAIIAPSEAVARRLRAGVRPLRPSPPVAVIPNGLDLEQVRPTAAPVSDGLGPWVGIVGPLTPGKGQRVFLRAAALVRRALPRTRFVVVGGEPYETWGSRGERPRLERLARTLGIAPAVTFTGFVEEPLAWIRRCDLLVSASTTPEGFGRVLLEAMALGKPVIATAVGASPEVVEDGVTGVLVPPEDPTALARAIGALVGDPARQRQLGAAGRRRAEQRFSLAAHVRAVEQVYRAVLRGTGGPP